MLFSTSNGKSSANSSNRPQYEIGKVIDEIDLREFDIANIGAPDNVDIEYNTSSVDLSESGLTDEEAAEVSSASAERLDSLKSQLASELVNKDKNINTIRENQKDINETNDLIKAISVIEGSDTSIREKLEGRLESLQATQNELLEERDSIAVTISNLYDDIRALGVIVR